MIVYYQESTNLSVNFMYGRFLHKAIRYWLGGGIRKENSNYSSEELGIISEKRTFEAPDVSESIHT